MRSFLSPTLNMCSGRRSPINTHESVSKLRYHVRVRRAVRRRERPWLCDQVRSNWIVLWIVLVKCESSRLHLPVARRWIPFER